MGQTEARKETENGDEWISLAEAARQLGQTRHSILQRAVAGEIVAQHIAGRTVVTKASVDAAKAAENVRKDVANSRKHGRNPAAAR